MKHRIWELSAGKHQFRRKTLRIAPFLVLTVLLSIFHVYYPTLRDSPKKIAIALSSSSNYYFDSSDDPIRPTASLDNSDHVNVDEHKLHDQTDNNLENSNDDVDADFDKRCSLDGEKPCRLTGGVAKSELDEHEKQIKSGGHRDEDDEVTVTKLSEEETRKQSRTSVNTRDSAEANVVERIDASESRRAIRNRRRRESREKKKRVPSGRRHDQSSAAAEKNNVSTRIPSTSEQVESVRSELSSESDNCDLFSGEWVPNPEGPYYTNETCWAIQQHQNCMKFGRPDSGYLKWRWKPDRCELPVFDPHRFLEIMRGKSLAFVGDSVARNHMQSLICLLSRVADPVDVSNTTDENFKRWEYRDYNFNISKFWSPYLVRTERTDPNDITRPFNLFLDEFDQSWTTQIEKFDYVIISAGHWFFRPTMFYVDRRLVGCLYCPEANVTHLTSSFSYRRAFRTAFRAINSLTNFKGVTLLRTFAPSHFENGPWDKGGDCVRTRPFRRNEKTLEGYALETYMIQLQELEIAQREGRRKGLKFGLFDATRPMLLRPDGHPSKYGHWPVPENVTVANDCVHWCLPGPIDSWNDILLELFRRDLADRSST